MTRHQVLDRVAERYRSEGYEVTKAAATGALPIEIDHARNDVDLIAHKGDEWVVVQVKRRDQLYEINPLAVAIKQDLPEWRYDLVVYPPDGVDEVPLEDGEPDPDYIESLFKEAQDLLASGMLRASLLIVWSATESAMRTSARRENI
jgi:REase_AHJR-like